MHKALLFWAIILTSAATMANTQLDDASFLDVELNTYRDGSCSPEAPAYELDWTGIIITAPSVIYIDTLGHDDLVSLYRAPICGYYLAEVLIIREHPLHMRIESTTTGRVYESDINFMALIADVHRRPYISKATISEEDLKNMKAARFFNASIASFVDLPHREDTYTVVFSRGPYQSNTLSFQVKLKPDEHVEDTP